MCCMSMRATRSWRCRFVALSILFLSSRGTAGAEGLRVVPLGTRSQADSVRVGLSSEHSEIALRFVQLDEDPAWEAVLVAVDLTGLTPEVRVFDKQPSGWVVYLHQALRCG